MLRYKKTRSDLKASPKGSHNTLTNNHNHPSTNITLPETYKALPNPSLAQRNEKLLWENLQLEELLKCERKKTGASTYLVIELKHLIHELVQTLENFQKIYDEVEMEMKKEMH